MKLKAALLVALLFAGSASAQIYPPMPQPMIESMPPAPCYGCQWQPGYWAWNNVQWVWVAGSWIAPRASISIVIGPGPAPIYHPPAVVYRAPIHRGWHRGHHHKHGRHHR